MKGFTLLFLTMTAKKGCAVVSATADETVGTRRLAATEVKSARS